MKKLKMGVIGAGRLGIEHARNIANHISNTELVAICNRTKEKAQKLADELEVKKVYDNPLDLCKDPEVEAVAIVTNTASHTEVIQMALENGKHIFCEKPLADTIEKCKTGVRLQKQYPNLICMLGHQRRFDSSFLLAKEKIERGDIGEIVMVRCASQDPLAIIDGFLEYAPRSGGIFYDLAIHDIDMIHWLSGSEPESIYAIGKCYAYKQLEQLNDADNVSCLIKNKNGVMGYIYAGRAAAQGTCAETEIIGTKGTLRIGAVPTNSLLEVMSEHGVCRECYQDFVTRWHDAYINEMEYFANCVLTGTKASPDFEDGLKAVKVAFACRESFVKNELITM